jgi:hypothetical protein
MRSASKSALSWMWCGSCATSTAKCSPVIGAASDGWQSRDVSGSEISLSFAEKTAHLSGKHTYGPYRIEQLLLGAVQFLLPIPHLVLLVYVDSHLVRCAPVLEFVGHVEAATLARD